MRNQLYHHRRFTLKMTQKEVAKRARLSQQVYSCYESGIRDMRLSDARAVADILNLTLDQLYEKLTTYEVKS